MSDNDFLGEVPVSEALSIAEIAEYAYSSANLAEAIEPSRLSRIGTQCVRGYEMDDASRQEWLAQSRAAMDMAKQVVVAKTQPWPGASNIKFPLLTTAAMQFAARAYAAIVVPKPVKAQVNGKDPDGQKQDRADRVSAYMSYQLLDQMDGWAADTDLLLMNLPITGMCFRKTFFDAQEGKPVSTMITADKLVVNMGARTLESAPRVTEVFERYPYEVRERMNSGFWLDVDLGRDGDQNGEDDQAPMKFIEQSCLIDMDDDGYPEPYCVTVHVSSSKVVRIAPRFDADAVTMAVEGDGTQTVVKIEATHYYTAFRFLPDPDGGFYGIGFGQLLAPINSSIDTILNQLVDAGTLANLQGGFLATGSTGIASGLKGGTLRFPRPGELKPVQVAGPDLRQAMVMVDFKPPSAALLALLELLIGAGKEIATISDIVTGDASNQASPTTTLALIEQGMKVYTAIYARIHRSLKDEFRKLYRLNGTFMNPEEQYRYQDEEGVAYQQDFMENDMDITPVSDPRDVSDMVRLSRAGALMQFIGDPMCNGLEIRKRIFQAQGQENVDQLLVTERPPPNPQLMADAAKTMADVEKTETETVKIATEIVQMGGPVMPVLLEETNETMPDFGAPVGGMDGPPGDGSIPQPPVPDAATAGGYPDQLPLGGPPDIGASPEGLPQPGSGF